MLMLARTALLRAGSLAGGGFSTWNPSDKDTSIDLSNGNLTAVGNGGGLGDGVVRGKTSRSSGQFYFEVTVSGGAGNPFVGIGIATASAALSAVLGSDAAGWGFAQSGGSLGLLKNNGLNAVVSAPPFVEGDVIGVHIDLTGALLYLRINATNWHSMNPAAGTGGQAIASGSWFPAMSSSANTEGGTLNVGATPFANAPASGFLAWG